MILIYYPLILFSILGYGFFASKKILSINSKNLGYQGIIGIFSLLIISYFSSQFFPHGKIFNLIILIVGLYFFLFYFKKIKFKIFDFYLLLFLILFYFIFIFISKNHDDFFYYHFPYILHLVENTHSIGLGNLNHGFKTHSSIFLLSSLFYLPGVDYYLFHIGPAYIMIFSNFIFLKLLLNNQNLEKYKYLSFLSLFSFIFINIFFYRLAEHGTDRSAMVLIILLVVNLIFYMNKEQATLNNNFLKIFAIIFTIIISLKAFYIIYIALFLPLILFVYKKEKSIKIFFNLNLLLCFLLFIFVILTNFFNTGCLLFPEKNSCFFNFSWSITLETVEILKTHYENWAKAGSGAGYTNSLDKVIYTNNYNWFSNWIDKYFFNKVLDFILSLIFMAIISLIVFKNKKIINKNARSYKLIFYILLIIGFIWFTIHPSLRYGGFHLFFLLTFIPLSLYLENYSLEIKNFEFKIKTMLTITLLVFFTRNIDRLITENEIYSYSLIKNLNYSIDNEEAFKIQKRFKKLKENKKLCDQKSQKCNNELYKLKKIYNNRYIISRN